MQATKFGQYSDLAAFCQIPAMDMAKFTIVDADDYGDDWYVMELQCSETLTYSDFKNYVDTLESAGFQKCADNGSNGIENVMFSATLVRGNTVVALTFITSIGTVYIATAENKPVSPHHSYQGTYVSGNIPGKKTTLTMHAFFETANCYILQLKNGHYIVNDGGFNDNTKMLVEWLIENAPAGQKPVIEAWFISHEHHDHVSVLCDIECYAEDIAVEGFYCNAASDDVIRLVNMIGHMYLGAAKRAALVCKNSAGEPTPLYRMHAGERYYFNDITVEVLYTCEQVKETDYNGDLNTSSTWLMYYIDGQKFLLNGDTDGLNMQHVARYFDRSFFSVDVMSAPHHGYNFYSEDPGFYRAKTLIYASPYFMNNGWWKEERKAANRVMQSYCQECFSWADGSKRLTFPYTVGSVETIPCWYPELVAVWTENQAKWAKELGIDWTPAKITE